VKEIVVADLIGGSESFTNRVFEHLYRSFI
jgi:hypothetical protein